MNESWFRHNPWLAVAGVIGSILLSLWTLHIDGIINNDGVHYIVTAEHIARGEWSKALAAFKWPAYSFLIYLFQFLPGLDYEGAAHVVTSLGFAMAVLGFISAVHALGGRGRVLWLALATVLAYPGFNEIRAYLIRDAMFLGFYLFALAGLLRYVVTVRTGTLASSVACLLAAALFRVEALMIALLLPALINSGGDVRRRRGAVAIYLVVVIPILALFYGWWIFRPEDGDAAWTGLSEPWRVFNLAMDQVLAEFRQHLAEAGLDESVTGILAGLGIAARIVLVQTVDAMSLPYALILLVETLRRRATAGYRPVQRRLIGSMVVLHLVALLAFAIAKFFLAPRYPVALAVTLVLAVPFILDRYLDGVAAIASRTRRTLAATGLFLLMVLNAAEGVDNFSDKAYLRDGALWLRNHAEADYRLASNDMKFVFYAGRYDEKWVAFREDDDFRRFLVTGQWKWKDYVAVNIRHSEPGLGRLVSFTLQQAPIRQFNAKNGDRLLIFYTGDD